MNSATELSVINEEESVLSVADGPNGVKAVVPNASRRSLLTKGAAAIGCLVGGRALAHVSPTTGTWQASDLVWNAQKPPAYALHFVPSSPFCLGTAGAPYSLTAGAAAPAAKGDGTTDDTAALQYAIDWMREVFPNGGKLFLPGGVYLLSKPLVMRQGICLYGENYGSVTLKLANSASLPAISGSSYYGGASFTAGQNRPLVMTTVYTTHMALENLAFNGNRSNQNSEADLVQFWLCTVSCYIRNVFITGARGRALSLGTGADIIVQNLWVNENTIPHGKFAVEVNPPSASVHNSVLVFQHVFIENSVLANGYSSTVLNQRGDGLKLKAIGNFVCNDIHFEGCRTPLTLEGGFQVRFESISIHDCGGDPAATPPALIEISTNAIPVAFYIGFASSNGVPTGVRWMNSPVSFHGLAPMPNASVLPCIAGLHLVDYGSVFMTTNVQPESVICNNLHIIGAPRPPGHVAEAAFNLYQQTPSGDIGNTADIAFAFNTSTNPRYFIRQKNGNETEFGSTQVNGSTTARTTDLTWVKWLAGTAGTSPPFKDDTIHFLKTTRHDKPAKYFDGTAGSFTDTVPAVRTGSGSPVGVVSALYAGHLYLDLTNLEAWIALATGTGNWKKIT